MQIYTIAAISIHIGIVIYAEYTAYMTDIDASERINFNPIL